MQRKKLRRMYHDIRKRLVRTFLAYGPERLSESLEALGVARGDCIMLHSSFDAWNGYRGTIDTLTDTFLGVIGAAGTLVMPSLPYRSAAYDYLQNLKCFDVRKTPSRMGLVSEFFRKRPGVLRSLHPTHPMLALGPEAEWIVEGHERHAHACGPDTPFDKLARLDGKVVFFNVPFATFTFFHYLEHLVSPRMPFPLYHEPPFDVPVIDRHGNPLTMKAYAFSAEAIKRRRFPVLEAELWKRGLIRKRRVGNSTVMAIRVRDAIECTEDMFRNGQYFYDLSGLEPVAAPARGEI